MPLLKDLEHDQCRYPITDEKPYLFCGRAKDGDSSYCPRHHKLCVQKKLKAIEFLADWVNQTDPMSAPAPLDAEEEVRPLDGVLI